MDERIEIPVDLDLSDAYTQVKRFGDQVRKETKSMGAQGVGGKQGEVNIKGTFDASDAIEGLRQMNSESGKSLGGVRNNLYQTRIAGQELSHLFRDLPYAIHNPSLLAGPFDRLAQTMTVLKAETGSFSAAFKGLFSSLAGSNGVLLAVNLLVSGFALFQDKIFGTGKAVKATDDELNNLTKDVVSQAAKLTVLVGIITNVNSTYDNKKKALQAINQEYKQYLGNISTEKVTLENIASSYDKIIDAMLRQAVVKGLQDEISNAVQKTAKELVALELAEERRRSASEASNQKINNQLTSEQKLQLEIRKSHAIIKDGTIAQIDHNREIDDAAGKYGLYSERVKRVKDALIDELKPLLNLTTQFKDLDIHLDNSAKKLKTVFENFKETPSNIKPELQVGNGDISIKGIDQDELQKSLSDLFKTPLTVPVSIDIYAVYHDSIKKLEESINVVLKQTAVEGFSNFGNLIGAALAGGNVKNAFQQFANIIGNGLQAIGKQMIALAPLVQALHIALANMLKNPAAAALLLPIGIGLVAAGAALRASISKGISGFAEGGLAFGPTLGVFGEGRGTNRSNPEVVSPLNKLKDFFGGFIQDNFGRLLNAGKNNSGGLGGLNIPDRILLEAHGRSLVAVLSLEQKSQFIGG
jgi:hypothetical protein